MKKIKNIILPSIMIFAISFLPAAITYAQATPSNSTGASNPTSDISSGVQAIGGGNAGQSDFNKAITTVVNVLLYLLGAISVIMIVIGGIRYATSNGDSSAVQSAKNTIMYAVIGVVVALIAYAIVNFVIAQFKK